MTSMGAGRRIVFVDNELATFLSHRLPLARAALAAGYEVHVLGPDGPEREAIQDAGCRCTTIPLNRRRVNPLGEYETVRSIERTLLKIQPDLIHLLRLKPVVYGAIASRKTPSIPLVLGLTGLGHAFSHSGPIPYLARQVVLRTLGATVRRPRCRIICQNPDDREILLKKAGIGQEKVEVILGSGVNVDEYSPRNGTVAGAVPTVVLASRMIWDKGISEFVAAARSLRKDGVNARFVLAGDTDPGNLSAIPRETLKGWANEGAIEWWGHRTDMSNVLRRVDIVCLPTAYREGVPKVLLEAAACGKPIVTTDSPGCREVVVDGVNGLLIPVHDANALSRAIGKLLQDGALRAEMGRKSRIRAVESFDVRMVCSSTINIYNQLLAQGTNTGSAPNLAAFRQHKQPTPAECLTESCDGTYSVSE